MNLLIKIVNDMKFYKISHKVNNNITMLNTRFLKKIDQGQICPGPILVNYQFH